MKNIIYFYKKWKKNRQDKKILHRLKELSDALPIAHATTSILTEPDGISGSHPCVASS